MAFLDNTQVYVTGVLYNSSAYPDNLDDIFDDVDAKFREITDLEFGFLSMNRSETRFSGGTTREQLVIFMKSVMFEDDSFLSDAQSNNLRGQLINKLDQISNLTYTDVEIRTVREET